MEETGAAYQLYVGVDLAAEAFVAAWLAPGGQPTAPFSGAQSPAGFAALQRLYYAKLLSGIVAPASADRYAPCVDVTHAGMVMFWSAVAQLTALLLDLMTVRRQAEEAKNLEIVLLRHQLRVLQHRQVRPPFSPWEKLTLVVLATRLRQLLTGARMGWSRSVLLVTPATVLRWHRDLVRRTWIYRQRRRAGSVPPTPPSSP